MSCNICKSNPAIVLTSYDKLKVCKICFFEVFETNVHNTIISTSMFYKGCTVGIGISGGKDSTVLAYVLNKLNKKYNYGVNLVLICVDEGIKGYRDHSIYTVHKNSEDLQLKLKIISYEELFGLSMDKVVEKIGKKNNCTYCGVFRRQALEEASRRMNVDIIVTGHNADDMAETVFLNLIRGDIGRLRRCTAPVTKKHVTDDNFVLSLPRAKPFKYSYQKEIVLYAYHKKLRYFSTECTYSPGASRGDVRNFIKHLEKIDSKIIINIIKNGDLLYNCETADKNVLPCTRCNHPTSSKDQICNACNFVNILNLS